MCTRVALKRVTSVTRPSVKKCGWLIKKYQCMKEEIKLILFLAQKADTLLKPVGGNRDA